MNKNNHLQQTLNIPLWRIVNKCNSHTRLSALESLAYLPKVYISHKQIPKAHLQIDRIQHTILTTTYVYVYSSKNIKIIYISNTTHSVANSQLSTYKKYLIKYVLYIISRNKRKLLSCVVYNCRPLHSSPSQPIVVTIMRRLPH